MSKFVSLQLKRSLSIHSCFPDIRSLNNSLSNSSLGEDDVSIDWSNVSDASGATLQQGVLCHYVTFSSDQVPPAIPPSQTLQSPIDFLKLEGSDLQLNPSLWPVNTGWNHVSSSAIEPSVEADTTTYLRQATFSHSNKVFEDIRTNSFITYVPLLHTALKGDWDVARKFLDLKPHAVSARITCNLETALHIAAGAKHTMFVIELVKLMRPEDLALQNKVGNTALCFAAASGVTKIAEVMVNKNNELPSIRGSTGASPLCMAALLGHRDMVHYLYSVTKEEDLTEEDHIELLVAAITADLYDVALELIQSYPQLAIARDGNGETALHVLARKPSAFPNGNQLGIWQRCLYSWTSVLEFIHWSVPSYLVPGIKTIVDTKLMHLQALELVKRIWKHVAFLDDSIIGDLLRNPSRLLFTAAALGNVEFLIVLIRMYPSLIWKVNEKSQSIFHTAVVHRQGKIFNLIHEIGAHKDLIAAYKDEDNNNMLHLAAKLAPPNRLKTDSGAALQLRRELHWFKEVEKIVQPSYREMKNSQGFTPRMLFSEEHKGLLREGEKWMKDTASSCMVVATLIATVMFAAAFTVPGGNDNNTGRPMFIKHSSFMVFAVSDALALFSSVTSILIFLSILTSRYAEEDFLQSLPNRLIIGLSTLFISMATMMIAFSATLFIVLGHGFAMIAIPISVVACVPVTLFALLQFPLFADVISHIYSFSDFFSPCNRFM